MTKWYFLILCSLTHIISSAQCNFKAEYSLNSDTSCIGENVAITQSIYYINNGIVDSTLYWFNPVRYLNNKEVFSADWDSSDGVWDNHRNLSLRNAYNKAGNYTISMITKDSTNCYDTAYLNVVITGIESTITKNQYVEACEDKVDLSSEIKILEAKNGIDEISDFYWLHNNNKISDQDSFTTSFPLGLHKEVALVVKSKNGCVDSSVVSIKTAMLTHVFRFGTSNPDTFKTTVSQEVKVENLGVIKAGDIYLYEWGDGATTSSTQREVYHAYDSGGYFPVQLTRYSQIEGTNLTCSITYPPFNQPKIVKVHDPVSVYPTMENTIQIFPNPTTNQLNVYSDKGFKMIKVISIDGTVFETYQLDDVLNETSLDISNLSSGMYMVEVELENKSRQQLRIVVSE